MEKYKISIIVAIYKSEKFIGKCIESIINQTYKNIEIILVDDGSPDNSGKICDEYANNDKRIIVIHKKNGGACEARNYGIKAATGDYITIVDGDDWLEKDFVSYLMNLIISTKTEMAMSINVFTTRDRKQINHDKISIWSSEKAFINLIYPKIMIGPWNKIYSSKLLKDNNITFCVPWSGEGLYFATTAVQNTPKIGVGRRKIYNYRLNNTASGLTDYNVIMGINALENIKNIEKNLKIRTPKIENAINWHVWKNNNFIIKLIVATDTLEENKYLYNNCIKDIRKMMINTFIKSRVNIKEKVKIIVQSLFPVLCAKYFLKKEKKALTIDTME